MHNTYDVNKTAKAYTDPVYLIHLLNGMRQKAMHHQKQTLRGVNAHNDPPKWPAKNQGTLKDIYRLKRTSVMVEVDRPSYTQAHRPVCFDGLNVNANRPSGSVVRFFSKTTIFL